MKYVMTIFWALIISLVVGYVLASMAGQALDVPGTLAIAAIFSIIVFLLGDGILKEEN
ncbi:Protein of unknown function [Gracilibacillus ureilyticus]|uniref:DUF2929 family protein n=1 Tax=Gracilibacillus ureilyticus TaxID=531814 RepID=A0A1H9SNK6_9BACI|nr:DUF2929 family protein [Gracilibacillus ureilyticus]SER86592.1 Protein of unknown function [Gracilibacillus ureilyticus]